MGTFFRFEKITASERASRATRIAPFTGSFQTVARRKTYTSRPNLVFVFVILLLQGNCHTIKTFLECKPCPNTKE